MAFTATTTTMRKTHLLCQMLTWTRTEENFQNFLQQQSQLSCGTRSAPRPRLKKSRNQIMVTRAALAPAPAPLFHQHNAEAQAASLMLPGIQLHGTVAA